MISIGNDIIDLKKIDIERTNQINFYSKILAASEVELYNDCKILSFENFVWLLWSVKESVFKHHKRNKPELLFSPKKIIAQHLDLPKNYSFQKFGKSMVEGGLFDTANCFTSKLQFDNHCFYPLSIIYTDLIFTIVTSKEMAGNICWGIKYVEDETYENQSKQVREFLLSKIIHLFDDELSFGKSESGCPVLIKNRKETSLPLSFTHHGTFIAYSFL